MCTSPAGRLWLTGGFRLVLCAITSWIRGYHLYAKGRRATLPIIDTFVTDSKYTDISCGAYLNNLSASTGFTWSVQAEDNEGNLGPVNDEGYFVFELCYLDSGQPCG